MKHVSKLDHADLADLAIGLTRARRLVDLWGRLDKAVGVALTLEQARALYLAVYKLRSELNATLGVLSRYRDHLAKLELAQADGLPDPAA